MRPVNPVVLTWATGNYPAGANAWNGLSKRTAPASAYWTPNTKIPAEEVNYVVGDLVDGMNNLFNFVGQCQAFNMQRSFDSSIISVVAGTAGLLDMMWTDKFVTGLDNARGGAWFALFSVQGGFDDTYLAWTKDNGITWTQLSDGAITPKASNSEGYRLGAHGTDELWLFTLGTTSRKLVMSTGTWTSGVANALSGTGDTIVKGAFNFNNLLIIYDSRDVSSYNGTTWTARSTSLIGASTDKEARHAASPTTAVIMRSDRRALTSPDGTTWTLQTAFGSAGSVMSLCYSDAYGKFFCPVANGTGTDIWSSSDGITWTLVSTVAQPSPATSNLNFQSIAALGSLLVAVNAGNTNNDYSMWYSADGGVNWSMVPSFRLPLDTSTAMNGSGPKLRVARSSSGVVTQLAAFNSLRGYLGMVTGRP